MIDIYPKPGDTIYIGQQGDNRIKMVHFKKEYFQNPVAQYMLTDGAWIVKAQRSQDSEPYLCAEAYDSGSEVLWIPNAGDTEFPGIGMVQVEFLYEGAVQQSVVWPTKVYPSLQGVKDPPDVWKSWSDVISSRLEELENRPSGGGSGSGDVDLDDIYTDLGSPISSDMDLSSADYYAPGVYYAVTDAIAASLLHCPTTKAFRMAVFNTKDSSSRVRIILPYGGTAADRIYIDCCDGNWAGFIPKNEDGYSLTNVGLFVDPDITETSIATGTYKTVGSFTLDKGRYMISAVCSFEANATGYRLLGLSETQDVAPDRDYIFDIRPAITAASVVTYVHFTFPYEVPYDNYTVYINAYQNSGSTLDIDCSGEALMIC